MAKILFLDDDITRRRLIREVFKNYEISEASNR